MHACLLVLQNLRIAVPLQLHAPVLETELQEELRNPSFTNAAAAT